MKLEKVMERFAQALDDYYGQQDGVFELLLPSKFYDEFNEEYAGEYRYRPVPPTGNLKLEYVFRTSAGTLIRIRRQQG